jgi:signal peptidase
VGFRSLDSEELGWKVSNDAETTRGLSASSLSRRSLSQVRWLICAAIYVLLFVAVGTLLAATLPSFRGFHTATIYGGSMGRALPAGSVAVSRPVDVRELDEGDIVAIGGHSSGLPTFHRIVSIEDVDGRRILTTRGDANATNDPQPITVQGRGDRVVYHIPWIGYFLAFARAQLGLALLVGLPCALWLGRQLVAAWRSRRRVLPAPS